MVDWTTEEQIQELEKARNDFEQEYPDAWVELYGGQVVLKQEAVLEFAENHGIIEEFNDGHGVADYSGSTPKERLADYMSVHDSANNEGVLHDMIEILAIKRLKQRYANSY